MNEQVQVDASIVLYAFRYGLGRLTYAHGDALGVVRANWSAVRKWRETIERDLQATMARCTGSAIECGMRDQCAELLAWISDYESQRTEGCGSAWDEAPVESCSNPSWHNEETR